MGLQMIHKDKSLTDVAVLLGCGAYYIKKAETLDDAGFVAVAKIACVVIRSEKTGATSAPMNISLGDWCVLVKKEHLNDCLHTTVLRNIFNKGLVSAMEAYEVTMGMAAGTDKTKASLTPKIAPKLTHAEVLLDNSPLVPLFTATRLGQRVQGTVPTSIYHVVAVGEKANVAIRIKANYSLSIRVEGPGLLDYSDDLTACGLTYNSTSVPSWWSVHLEAKNLTMAKKAVGAVLLSIGIPFTRVLFDIEPFVGSGT